MTVAALKESVLEALEGLQLPWEQQLKRPMGARAQSMLRVSISQVGAVCMRV